MERRGRSARAAALPRPSTLYHSDDEAWYVLEGKLWVRSGDEIVEASAGAAVFVPRGTPHTYWNPTAGLTRYLLVMTSRTHRMIQQIHMLTDRSLPSMRPLFQNYDSELL